MFTGLVEEKGVVESIISAGPGSDLCVHAPLVSQGAAIGDSVSINGCCLTIVAISDGRLTFQAGTETIQRTNLGALSVGVGVNLERSLKVGDRMGGHFVTGHIDGIGQVTQRDEDGEWAEFWFEVPPALTKQMASKGSVAVDGVSLTLVNVEVQRFSIALIPHTLHMTTLGDRKVGDSVNIETDVLAKYVQQQISDDASSLVTE